MDNKRITISTGVIYKVVLLLLVLSHQCTNAWNLEYEIFGQAADRSELPPKLVMLEEVRHKRDVVPPVLSATTPAVVTTTATGSTANVTAVASNVSSAATPNITDDSNRTTNLSLPSSTTATPTSVTRIPLLGFNGSGIYKGNLTTNLPKVSEPISPDDNLTVEVFSETPEMIKAQHNLTDLQYDDHSFYTSVFIGNVTYFKEHWDNITRPKAEIHQVLSNSHRRATTVQLSFEFPFYGLKLRNITVATGGFIYTGDHVHNWLAATQYIAPLMANFDTTVSNDSVVKFFDDGEKFTVLWENVQLQEEKNKNFTFAVTLYKNGDIAFSYKTIPMPIQEINDSSHPVKVGISDAYLTDKILIHVRRKTIYEYHRVSFKNYEIGNFTILKLEAQKTCLQYNTCESCVNHDTDFNCTWCSRLARCSSGTDRNKQDWVLRGCDKNPISTKAMCPTRPASGEANTSNSEYITDNHFKTLNHDAVIKTRAEAGNAQPVNTDKVTQTAEAHTTLNGVVAAFVSITVVCGLVAWVFYAYKNPHTRSGQMLIKYRPSQWSWRRGEARYTAATIHM